METVVSAIIAFAAGVIGAFVGASLQRENWRWQRTLRAYAAALASGDFEVGLVGELHLAAEMGNTANLVRARKLLPGLIESPFRRQLRQCWLLEGDGAIRRRIETLEERYRACRLAVAREEKITLLEAKQDDLLQATADCANDPVKVQNLKEMLARVNNRLAALEAAEAVEPDIEGLEATLSELRTAVAVKYFRTSNGLSD